MNCVAVIPARGGSKGIPRKNLRDVGGLPLLAWSILAGLESKHVEAVYVSTEDGEIARVATDHGAFVIPRPAGLATDQALTDPVLVHAVEYLGREAQAPDLVVTLQPTVPFRAPGLVDACILRLMSLDADSLLTAYPLHFIWRQRAIPMSGGRMEWVTPTTPRVRRQDAAPEGRYYHEDGSVYVTRAEVLRRTGQRIGAHHVVFETSWSVDIDTEDDLAVANAMLRTREAWSAA